MEMESELGRLIEIIQTLRGDNGCPWDKKQTPQSFKKYLLEECNELLEAIEQDDTENICEELGDVYFVLSMITLMYAEKDKFTLSSPLKSINDKMIRRHPHVFGDAAYTDEETLRIQWEKIKSPPQIK